jgi:ABC-2 type transport system permease protein
MMREIGVVMRKELREMGVEGGGRRGRLTPLVGLAVAGVLLPFNFGVRYVLPETMMVMGLILPVLFVLPIVADTFAGERERHTLETLLATRLPDAAILFGKLAAIVSYAFVLSAFSLAIGLITVNVANPEARPLLMTPATLGMTVMEVVLVATLITGIGLLISLGAATVRQAQQRLSMILLVPMLIPAIVGGMPAGLREPLRRMLASGRLTPTQFLIGALVVLNVVILAFSSRRFQRSKLITS